MLRISGSAGRLTAQPVGHLDGRHPAQSHRGLGELGALGRGQRAAHAQRGGDLLPAVPGHDDEQDDRDLGAAGGRDRAVEAVAHRLVGDRGDRHPGDRPGVPVRRERRAGCRAGASTR